MLSIAAWYCKHSSSFDSYCRCRGHGRPDRVGHMYIRRASIASFSAGGPLWGVPPRGWAGEGGEAAAAAGPTAERALLTVLTKTASISAAVAAGMSSDKCVTSAPRRSE